MSDEYGISAKAREQAKILGLAPEEVHSYQRVTVPFSHPEFNRRYEGFVFKVVRRTVEEIGLYAEHGAVKPPEAKAVRLLQAAHQLLETLVPIAPVGDGTLGDIDSLVDEIEQYIGLPKKE